MSRLRSNPLIVGFLWILVCTVWANAQDAYKQVTSRPGDKITPPSPESSGLHTYAAFPVGLYTGIPDISIPLYTLTQGDVTVPIGLSYHASGIRLDQISSSVGTGWTLRAGGSVARRLKDEADEYGYEGFFYRSLYYRSAEDFLNSSSNSELIGKLISVAECSDLEPDEFSFVLPDGTTGLFAFDWSVQNTDPEKRIKVSCDKKVRIVPVDFPAPNANRFIGGFKIYGPDGSIYWFTEQEGTQLDKRYNPNYNCPYKDSEGYLIPPTTTWHLTRINGANSGVVDFEYDRYDFRYRTLLSQSYNHENFYDPATARDYVTRMSIMGRTLRRITTSEVNDPGAGKTTIEFLPSAEDRTDIPGRPVFENDPVPDQRNHMKSLQEVRVLNSEGDIVKRIRLGYDYSTGRLTLKNVHELPVHPGAVSTKPPYTFDYNSLPLPAFDTEPGSAAKFYEQDHRGYWNVNPDRKLVPRWETTDWLGRPIVYPGGDRTPNAERTQAGVLKKITYPTGGYTEFEFELNDFSFVGRTPLPLPDHPYKFPNRIHIDGGLRVKKITDSPARGGGENIVRRFVYRMADGTQSSGVIADVPRYESYGRQLAMDDSFGNWVFRDFLSRSSSSVVNAPTTRGNHVAYQRVEVLYGESGQGGKTESLFTSFFDHNDDTARTHRRPFVEPVSFDFMRGNLVTQIDYEHKLRPDGTSYYEPVRKIDNEYTNRREYIVGLRVTETCDGCRSSGSMIIDKTQPCEDCYPPVPPWVYTDEEPLEIFAFAGTIFSLGNSKLVKTTETLFGKGLTTIQNYTYDPALHFVEKQSTWKSEGKEIETSFYYPFHFDLPGHTPIGIMKELHMLTPVIETVVTEKSADGSRQVVDASFTEYQYTTDHDLVPAKQLKFAASVPARDFVPAANALVPATPDERYYTRVASFEKYNADGKPIQSTTPGGVRASYFWESGGSPTAVVDNASYSECAFINFETHDKGSWTFDENPHFFVDGGKTGKRSNSAPWFQSPMLPRGEYIVSVWAKSKDEGVSGSLSIGESTYTTDDTWKLYQWTIPVGSPGTITLQNPTSNGNLIDDLRLHPAHARMKTFTHEPNVGANSVTDANHQTIFYEYDELKRLKNVRDNEGNIVKNYRYVYREN